ncbi:monooxygenase 2-like isoform X2 [Spinacia oleracea]|uniref:Monooxygenase 2-like isoform X2 n=1 Tax=Spinacia oleracea TaxID=3562 RepID=A0A9R0JK44_SPIOL|nr:monooxygenase 2-like isoform X2 [Spinacia oleracea]
MENIAIVGGGITGLSLALALHRLGLKSLVLESSDGLRVAGAAFVTWTNAWKALDALAVGHLLRPQHCQLSGGNREVRCVKRRVLLETLANELPKDTIRFSSKVVSIQTSGHLKLIHLADGSILKTKVLVGCEGINSIVARWLGFNQPSFTKRFAIRGYVQCKENHGLNPEFLLFTGHGYRCGIIPCDPTTIYWFFTLSPSNQEQEEEIIENPMKMKQFVVSNLGQVEDKIKAIIEKTEVEDIICSPLRFRPPWEILWGDISKGNVCVAGDAFHPMTPDIGQGACSSLEDAIFLARYLSEAFSVSRSEEEQEELEYKMIQNSLKKYAKDRKWRAIDLVTTAYLVGFLQQSDGKVMTFLRDKVLAPFLANLLMKKADFDCGPL